MNKNLLLPIILVCGIAVGFVLPNLMGNTFAPSDHTAIAERVLAEDTNGARQAVLQLKFIRSGETRSLSMLPLSFVASGNVGYSVWEFRFDSNDGSTVAAGMVIFGPDDTDQFLVQFGKLTGDSMKVTMPDGLEHVLYDSWSGSPDGFIYAVVS